MACEGSKSCTQVFAAKLKSDERNQITVKNNETVKKSRGSQVRVLKAKGKYTLRTKSQRKIRIANVDSKKDQHEVVPYVPRKVFRALSILRHDKFLKLIARFFKPTVQTPAWNFHDESNEKSN